MDIFETVVSYVKTISKTTDSVEVMIVGNLMIVNIDNTSLSIIQLDYDTGFILSEKFSFFTKNSSDPVTLSMICKPMSAPMTNMDKKILGYYYNYMETLRVSPKVASYEELRGNEEYEKLLSMKSEDGAKFFRVIGDNPEEVYFVPVFTGFPNLNKADKIGISVYRIDQGTLLCEYHIYKKKINKEIVQYFRILDLGRK